MTDKLSERLRAPFPPGAVKWRITQDFKDGTGIAVPYVGIASVDARLDEVFGADGWTCAYDEFAGGVLCTLSAYVGEEKMQRWVSKQDGAQATGIESYKGGLTDARKRAAAVWGIGRYLALVGGRKVKHTKGRIQPEDIPDLPKWALPEEK